MSNAVVFDTNILPIAGDFSGPLWLTIERLCRVREIQMVLPELVIHESVNLRSEKYGKAAASLLQSLRAVSKFYDADAIYIPDVSEVAGAWSDTLRRTFETVAIHGDDAVEALSREANRIRPARSGRGGRDSAIWLTVLRLAEVHDCVYFVSRNTSDFGGGSMATLHPLLETEAAAATGTVKYFSGIDEFINSIAEPVIVGVLDLNRVGELIRLDARDWLVQSLADQVPTNQIEADALYEDGLVVRDLTVLRAFSVGAEVLILCKGHGAVPVGPPADGVELPFTFGAWLTFLPDEGIINSAELHAIASAYPEDAVTSSYALAREPSSG